MLIPPRLSPSGLAGSSLQEGKSWARSEVLPVEGKPDVGLLVNINHRVLKAAHYTPRMHWEKFINQLENSPELSFTLGQAVQGTQPVEAANDEKAAGEAMAEKAAASQGLL